MNFDKRLLTASPGLISNFVLELTDKCNLRCVYCHQNLPDFVATRNMTQSMVARVLEYFGQVKPPFINLTGGGDLIMAPDWEAQCRKMLGAGIPLRATVNLGKLLGRAEAEVFARFSALTVSIDTVDPQLLRQFRKAVDIRTISQNILTIKSAALRLGLPGPQWFISAVYYAEITHGLVDVVSYAATIGAHMFSLQDLLEYGNIHHNVTPVWQLRGDAAVRAVADTRLAIAAAEKLGLELNIQGDFVPRLNQLEKDAYAPIPLRSAA